MRKKNSNAEFASERSELLLRNFRESIRRQSIISAKRAFCEAADMPAPRFWVTEARATRIIRGMIRGEDPTDGMNIEKKAMYQEIFNRVMKMKKENPEMAIGDIVFTVVNNPAPHSYLSWQRARGIISKAKRG